MSSHPSRNHIANTFSNSESLYESEQLPQEAHDSAALLASKVYYYLGDYEEALSFALGAGSAFENDTRSPGTEEYVETVVCECPGRAVLAHALIRAFHS